MWRLVFVAPLLAAGCAPREPAVPRQAMTERCTLRVAETGLLVDGEPMSLSEAVAYCKTAEGGAVVVMDGGPARTRDEVKLALEREGVRVYVRGDECMQPDPMGCRPVLWPPTTPAEHGQP